VTSDSQHNQIEIKKTGPWVDNHLHLFVGSWFRGNVFEARTKTKRRRQLAKPLPTYYDADRQNPALRQGALRLAASQSLEEKAELLVAEMDAAGLDKAILMAMDWDMTGEKLAVSHWDQLVQLAAVRDKHPGRFLIFCGMDLRRGKEGLPLFERAVKELGCVGLKLLPHWGFYPNDKEMCYPYYERCVEWNIPVTSNCSSLGSSHVAIKYCHPALWEDVAYDFSEMNICLAHSGIPYHYEYALSLAISKHNIYMDVGDWQAKYPHEIGDYFRLVRRAMDSPARRKIMFASDWPVFRGLFDEKSWVELLTKEAGKYGFAFSEEELNLFFSENVQDYLDLDL